MPTAGGGEHRRAMKRLPLWIAAVAAMALVVLAIAAFAFTEEHEPTGKVTVTGSGFVELTRDRATMSIGVSVLKPTAKAAMAEAESTYAEVRAALLGVGAKAEDLTTSGISLYPEYDYWNYEGRKPLLLGYRAQISVSVETTIEVAAKIFDAAVTAGGDAVTLSGISFDVTGKAAANDQSRKRAIADARAKAALYADGLDMELGDALKVVEVSSTQPVPVMPDYNKGEGELPIDPGKARTTTVVEVTFEID